MFDPFQHMMNYMISRYNKNLENCIKEAFQEHFGFPIEDVKDTENLQGITVQGSPIESFTYRSETFLYYDHDLKFKSCDSDKCSEFSIETRFMKV